MHITINRCKHNCKPQETTQRIVWHATTVSENALEYILTAPNTYSIFSAGPAKSGANKEAMTDSAMEEGLSSINPLGLKGSASGF